jgi:hypothetical protein
MARRRSFANISRIASRRWQVKYTGPDGVRRYVPDPDPFARREDAETFVGVTRREIDRGRWAGDVPAQMTFGVYSQRWLANRHVAGRPMKDPTREHYQGILMRVGRSVKVRSYQSRTSLGLIADSSRCPNSGTRWASLPFPPCGANP